MELKTGTVLHGFRVTRVREVEELRGTLVELVHEKTGAPLVWMDNGEENKLFSVTFKTIPEDSTGVFHILEHTVLNGSDAYPVKEPFVELLKSSMSTFLNAMTFPDKTMYPVSSKNKQDYLNLASVYLDAVFAPRLLHNPNIFRQEGWHMEKDEQGLSYKGVVLNEMKGAMSDVDDVAEEGMSALLFPDTCYGFNSGGEPGVIQNLTYEKYVETYHRFYHPSNARFFLDGSVPLEETLSLIDSYLGRYERSDASFPIAVQAPVAGSKTLPYAIGATDPTENRTHYLLGGLLGTWKDRARILAFQVLAEYLAGNNESPLKQAVLQAGLAQDVEISNQDSVFQPWFSVHVRGTDEEKIPALHDLILKTVQKVIDEGVDKTHCRAILNRIAFHLKELGEPQGLIRAITCFASWLYGGDPLQYLVCDDVLAEVRQMLESGAFEALLRDLFIDGTLNALTLVPSSTCDAEMREKEQARLQTVWNAMNEDQRTQIENEQAELLSWQQTEDSPESLSTIPILPISEIDPKPTLTETIIEEHSGVRVLYHPVSCHGIVHVNLYFDLPEFSLDDLTGVSILTTLITMLPTSKHSVQELQRAMYEHTGVLSFSNDSYAPISETKTCRPMLKVSFSALPEHVQAAQKLVMELLLDTCYDSEDRIRELVEQAREAMRNSVISSGHVLGRLVTLAHFSALNAVDEAMRGETMYEFLEACCKDIPGTTEKLQRLVSRLRSVNLTRSHLTVSITSDENNVDLSPIFSELPAGGDNPVNAPYVTKLPEKAGKRIPAQISFAVAGTHLNIPYCGSMQVISKIVSLEYLWNMVRVQGGAYGSGLQITRSGNVSCYSFRDPSPARSLKLYQEIGNFLRSFAQPGLDCTKYILSAVSDTEPLLPASAKGKNADARYFSNVTYEDIEKNRGELLKTDQATILSFVDVLEKALADAAICVTGHADALALCEGLTMLENEA